MDFPHNNYYAYKPQVDSRHGIMVLILCNGKAGVDECEHAPAIAISRWGIGTDERKSIHKGRFSRNSPQVSWEISLMEIPDRE
jgi:hypothetical protein